jgi:hypothetical protein
MNRIEELRAQLVAIIAERSAATAAMDAVLTTPSAEGRALSADETVAFTAAKDALAAVKARQADLESLIEELSATAASEARAALVVPPVSTVKTGGAVVKSEARTYSPASDREGVSFIADVAGRMFGDFDASQRLARHMQEERVERGARIESRADAAVSNFAGLVVPQYLTDMVAPVARARRPLANIMNRHPLPAAGMTVNISRITTATTAAVQTENAAVSNTTIDDTLLSPAVITIAGKNIVSRQALERGTGVESVVVADLLAAVETKVDDTVLNAATTGLDALSGTVGVTYTDASPTVAELWPKLGDLIQQIQAGVFMGATHLVMAPRRFWWIATNVGTSFPFINFQGLPTVQGGAVQSNQYPGVAGILAGLPVILDGNCGLTLGAGTEDRIYAVTADEAHLWEDDVTFIRAEQPSVDTLGVQFVVYKYLAYTFGRYPGAHGKISGTGLIAPTF